ncbi:hypothetical protein Ahy_B06g080046 [Arachis hypogaea]|uniref:Uncharacterized protein n=1 Tax=Arachis hypogaea TaxID=3818 RepID=A0A444YH17_ARAHY|nr:hypothetical protein Ahy_B06g080046 [Arachis hypogaea]
MVLTTRLIIAILQLGLRPEISHDKQFYGDIIFSNNYLYALTQEEILLVIRFIRNFVNDNGLVVEEGDLLSSEDIPLLICPYRIKAYNQHQNHKILFQTSDENPAEAVEARMARRRTMISTSPISDSDATQQYIKGTRRHNPALIGASIVHREGAYTHQSTDHDQQR